MSFYVFNDLQNRSAFAYPTTVTDPAGNSSTVKYRHDIGANVRAQSPAPVGNTQGKISEREYDSIGRLSKDKIDGHGGAYTRYEYPTNGIHSKVFSTIIDTNDNGADTADEVLSESWADGAGRPRFSRVPHTFSGSSTATWAGSITEYDILGRVTRATVPTEVNSNWEATGDDLTRGFLWTHQKYDWMGRVVRKINTDGIDSPALNDSDVLISYDGCGCAGGLVVTVEGELVPRDDQPTVNGRRKQKVYADILGRTVKSESYEWNGTDIYATVVNSFNGRDQVTLSRQYAGNASSTTFQDTTASFDGHGRLASSHRPEQRDSSNNLKYTTYNYNPDDSISSVTDGRGVVTNYTYNNRRLVTNIGWDVGSTGVTDVTDVGFQYDNLGNRTSMTDGLGSVNYAYSSLSQLTSETRTFSDTLVDKPAGNYNLSYTYHLGGQLKAYTDPWGKEIAYSNDKAGRLTSVTSTSFGGVTTYANNPGYRAWGGLKHLEFGNGVQMDMTFNNRLQADNFELKKDTTEIMKKNYEYLADGKLKFVDDELNGIFDRLNVYDHVGRIKEGKSGAEARGGTVTDPEQQKLNLPYRQSYTFNAFNNLTQRNNLHWGVESWYGQSNNLSYTYENNRITNTGWQYDADGRVIQSSAPDDYASSVYDARGLLSQQHTYHNTGGQTKIERFYSGDGREGKRTKSIWVENETPPNYGSWTNEPTIYYIRSSVLGGEVISETTPTGRKKKTFVLAAGAKIATQFEYTYNNTTTESVSFDHTDAAGMSYRSSLSSGSVLYNDGAYDGAPAEFDPMGGNVGISTPYIEEPIILPPPEPDFPYLEAYGESPSYVNGQRVTCSLDGFAIGCSQAMSMLDTGSALPASIAHLQNLPGFRFESLGLGQFRWHPPDNPGNGMGATNTSRGPISGEETIRVNSLGGAWRYIFFAISWIPQPQTPQSQPFDSPIISQTRGRTLTGVVRDAVSSCLKSMFGLELGSFQIADSTNGTNGRVVLNTAATSGAYGRPPTFYSAVTTNVQYSLGQFNQMTGYSLANGAAGATRGLHNSGVTPTGYTLSYSTNYKFNDQFPDASKFRSGFHELARFLGATDLVIQIHELGNSAAGLTGISFEDPNRGDSDSGEAYETCVRNELKRKRRR